MKEVNTPDETLKKSIENNLDIEYNEKLEEKHNTTVIELDPKHKQQWCPGCGNFGILLSVKKALVKLGLSPKDVVVVSGIGCSGKHPHYIKTYGVETLHGRALPVATGIKLANKDLHVIVVGGDGDGYGIGVGHFIHAMRRNINLTYIVHNNEIYGLTKGQASPTSPKGTKSVSTPNGSIESALNPIELALAGGASFVAKGFAGDIEHLSNLIAKAIKHKGFSFIDTAQPCVSYNPILSYNWYNQRIKKIENIQGYDVKDKVWSRMQAIKNQNDEILIGIFYQNEILRETYIDDLPEDKKVSLVRQNIENINVENLLDNYK